LENTEVSSVATYTAGSVGWLHKVHGGFVPLCSHPAHENAA
jgi:hypothetical protein